MTPYGQRYFTDEALAAWHRACELVAKVPDDFTECDLRCHELARAVANIVGGTVIDGHFGGIAHSWISLADALLDPYQPGTLPQCVLIDTHAFLPHARLYEPGDARDDIEERVVFRLTKLFEAS